MARLANQMKQLYAMCATALVMGRADLDGADDVGFDIELPIFTVGQTAELANIHPPDPPSVRPPRFGSSAAHRWRRTPLLPARHCPPDPSSAPEPG